MIWLLGGDVISRLTQLAFQLLGLRLTRNVLDSDLPDKITDQL